jgi:EAL domain-containing protein (putative c-di-GMP-specific phosphodiesterase class I)
VRDLDHDDARQALVAGLGYFAQRTHCALVAERVEREGEADALRRLGVAFGQGYLFGAPEPIDHWT